jgi:hypothetical protein
MELPLALPRPLTLATLFAVGAVVGTLTDQIHLLGGVIAYPAGGLFGQPFWVPLQYGFAAIAMSLPARFIVRDAPGAARDLAAPTVWFVGAYVASALFQQWPVALAAAMLFTFAARAGRARMVWLFALSCAVGGVAWEIALVWRGHFLYLAPHAAFGVPWWLFGLYLHAALLLRQVARLL